MKVAVIGLGAMGLGMARSLLGAGHAVGGCDVSEAALAEFAAAGGRRAASPAEAARGCEALLIAVVNAEQCEAVLFGEGGACETLAEGAVVVLCPTVPPAAMRALCDRLSAAGYRPIDAPMSGGIKAAQEGRLTLMAAGAPEAFETVQPLLDAIAAKVYRLGEVPGQGTTVKIAHQLLAGVHIATAAEAMAFGTRIGCDPETLYEVVCNAAGQSWMFENRVPFMLDGDWHPVSAVEIFVKDLGLVLEAGKAERFPLPLAAAAHQLFLAAAGLGHGAENDAAVVKVYEALSGIDVRRRSDD